MKTIIFLSLGVFLIGTSSALASDTDVGKISKSELVFSDYDLTALAPVAIMDEVVPMFTSPSAVDKLPVSKGTNVKPSKAVNIFRRARDAI